MRNAFSAISAGTERARVEAKSALDRAKERPELVRELAVRAMHDGIAQTVGAVRAKLFEETPGGYSSSGMCSRWASWCEASLPAIESHVPAQVMPTMPRLSRYLAICVHVFRKAVDLQEGAPDDDRRDRPAWQCGCRTSALGSARRSSAAG